MRDSAKKKSYETLASEHQPLIQTRQTRQEIRLRNSTGYHVRYKIYGGFVLVMCLLLMWFVAWTGKYHTSAHPPIHPPTGPSHHVQYNGQLPVYLWLVEHDPDVHDQELTTLKSLYTADRFLTNTSDGTLLTRNSYQSSSGWTDDAMGSLSGCNSMTDTSVWNLNRASYADVLLDDESNSEYQGIQEADMIICERAGFDSTHASQIKHCRLLGNDYFSREDPDRRPWLPIRVFRVSPNFNLAFRPGHWGHRRVYSCLCSSSSSMANTIAKASKSAHRLIVNCLDQSASVEEQGISQQSYHLRSSHGEGKLNAESSYTLPPGLYVVPNVLSESYMALSQVLEPKDHKSRERMSSEEVIATRAVTAVSTSHKSRGNLLLSYLAASVVCAFAVGYVIMRLRGYILQVGVRWRMSREDRRQREAIELFVRGTSGRTEAEPSPTSVDGSLVAPVPPAPAITADPTNGSLHGSAGPTHDFVDKTPPDFSSFVTE
ncbi:MAG: hypothetical protein Q9202_005857 [Teloschistes flavicans]